MANKAFPTLPGTINIPSGLNDFKAEKQVVWTASNWAKADSAITINYGPAAGQVWESDENFELNRQENMYQTSSNSGLRVYGNAATQRSTVFRMTGNSRWMPASVFNGIGFETLHQNVSGSWQHDLYVAEYAVHFKNRTGNGNRYYGWNTGYSESPGSNGYRFDRIPSTASDINTIRAWGSDWLYQGLVMTFRSKLGTDGTAGQSYITIYNMKVGSKFSTVGGQYRYLPLKNRSASNRDGSVGNKGFSNPFQL